MKHSTRISGLLLLATSVFPLTAQLAPVPETSQASEVHELVGWLLKNDATLKEIPFSEVIEATSGKKIIPIDRVKDADVLRQIDEAMQRVLSRMNAPESPIKRAGRINEASHFFEDAMQEELGKVPGWKCGFPLTADGRVQRSGYPDLQLDLPDGRTYYLDPKLYARGSRRSTFRTFYFEPRNATNKVTRDACHLIVGIEHDFEATGRFLKWELIDLGKFKVRLKAEFEGSNRDLYRDEWVVGKGDAQ